MRVNEGDGLQMSPRLSSPSKQGKIPIRDLFPSCPDMASEATLFPTKADPNRPLFGRFFAALPPPGGRAMPEEIGRR